MESTLRAAGYISSQVNYHADTAMESPESYGLAGVKQQPVGDRKGGVVWHTQGSGKIFIDGVLYRKNCTCHE
ncbi:MAG: hypothetical protein ROZ36_07935 [Thermincola sp.]|nr:hypothetical protein [Thermincola sp.]